MSKAIVTAAVDAERGNEYVPAKVINAVKLFVSDRQENGVTVLGSPRC